MQLIKTNPPNTPKIANVVRNNDSNPSANAIGLKCMVPVLVDDNNARSLCNNCVENCADSSKVCPQYCLCRWYGDSAVKLF